MCISTEDSETMKQQLNYIGIVMKTNMIKYKIDKGRAVFVGDKVACYEKMKKLVSTNSSEFVLIEDIEVPDDLTGEELLDFASELS